MAKTFYNKLCRDKVPDLIKEKGFECEVRKVEKEEFQREIIRKVAEEAGGVMYHVGREHLLKELADLLITIDAVRKAYDISEYEIKEAVTKNVADRGAYDKQLYISWSSDTEYSSRDKAR